MQKLIIGIASHAICSGISIFLGLPQKVAAALSYPLSMEQSLGLSLIFGGICAWGAFFLFSNKWKFNLASVSEVIYGVGFSNGTHSIHSFGYTISRPHNLCLIGGIKLTLVNKRKAPLIVKTAYLKSLVTGEKVIGDIGKYKCESLSITGKNAANLWFKFQNKSGYLANEIIKGLTLDEFEKCFSNFEIVIKTDRKNFRFLYDSKTTRDWVNQVQMGLMTPTPAEKAVVLPADVESL